MIGNSFRNMDWITFGLYFLLASLGVLSIYSSAFIEEMPSFFSMQAPYGKQIMWGGFSLILGGAIFLLKPDFIQKNGIIFYLFTILLLILVLVVGEERNGAKAWFGIGSFGIQPAEFSKVAVALVIAKLLADTNAKKLRRDLLFQLAGFIGLPILLIMLQPDLGSVLVFTSFILVLYREGLSGNVMLYGLLGIITTVISLILSSSYTTIFGMNVHSNYILAFTIVVISLLIFVYINIFFYKRYRRKRIIKLITVVIMTLTIIPSSTYLFNKIPDSNYQKQRMQIVLGLLDKDKILTQLDIEQAKLKKAKAIQHYALFTSAEEKIKELNKLLKIEAKVGYNIHKALSAIGSGQTTGKGYMNATLANNKFKWVPEQSTDFIFCTYAEEWGFLGGFILFILFLALIIRLIFLAERQRGTFGRVYIYSVACILFLHFTINIGMVMGIAPIIGIPLPFFSYGGSSLLAFSIMIFIALKLDADRLDVLR